MAKFKQLMSLIMKFAECNSVILSCAVGRTKNYLNDTVKYVCKYSHASTKYPNTRLLKFISCKSF